ncbi:ATP-binding protein [Nocardia sp. NPDC003482]
MTDSSAEDEHRAKVADDLYFLFNRYAERGAINLAILEQRTNLRQYIADRLQKPDAAALSGAEMLEVLRAIDSRARPFPNVPSYPAHLPDEHKVLAVGILIRLYESYPADIVKRREVVEEKLGAPVGQLRRERWLPNYLDTYLRFIDNKLTDDDVRIEIIREVRVELRRQQELRTSAISPPTALAPEIDSSGADIATTDASNISSGARQEPSTTLAVDWERWKRYAAAASSTTLVGVEAQIATLSGYLTSDDPGPVVVSGAGGMGKTSVLLKAMQRIAKLNRFAGAMWTTSVNFRLDRSDRPRERDYDWHQILASLALQMDVDSTPAVSRLERDIRQRIEALPSYIHLLCIVDNLEGLHDGTEVIEQLTSLGLRYPHCVAITSRSEIDRVRYGDKHIKMLPLGPEDTADLACLVNPELRSAGEVGQRMTDEIYRVSHGNPYIIRLVATQSADAGLPLDEIIADLEQSDDTYEYLFQRSLDILGRFSSPELAFFLMQGFCRFRSGVAIGYKELRDRSLIESDEDFKRTLSIARRLNLIQTTEINQRYSIHSLLHEYLKRVINA